MDEAIGGFYFVAVCAQSLVTTCKWTKFPVDPFFGLALLSFPIFVWIDELSSGRSVEGAVCLSV